MIFRVFLKLSPKFVCETEDVQSVARQNWFLLKWQMQCNSPVLISLVALLHEFYEFSVLY